MNVAGTDGPQSEREAGDTYGRLLNFCAASASSFFFV
jgi:hypothetical protein